MAIKKIFQRDGDAGIKQTLENMSALVTATDENRTIKEKARQIISDLNPDDELGQIRAIFAWVQSNLKYVRDIYGVEELTRPDRVVYNIDNGKDTHSSNCADFAKLLSALLRSVGFRTRVEAIAFYTPDGYDHARCAVYSQTLNEWLPLEGTRPGVEIGFGLESKKTILGLEIL